mmetsp:Transcript_53792/g.117690  ORF Transcript_53792/g.117690 Transcript_53792/m.117690 type:complete len:169 (+) Transcript_53792:230-736(+)
MALGAPLGFALAFAEEQHCQDHSVVAQQLQDLPALRLVSLDDRKQMSFHWQVEGLDGVCIQPNSRGSPTPCLAKIPCQQGTARRSSLTAILKESSWQRQRLSAQMPKRSVSAACCLALFSCCAIKTSSSSGQRSSCACCHQRGISVALHQRLRGRPHLTGDRAMWPQG